MYHHFSRLFFCASALFGYAAVHAKQQQLSMLRSTFSIGKGNVIQIKTTSPQYQEIEIRNFGSNKKNFELMEEDCKFLVAPADSLETDAVTDTDTVDSPTFAKAHRMASLLRDWPATLDIDFKFDKEKEMDCMKRREKDALEHTPSPDAPSVSGEGRKLRSNKVVPGFYAHQTALISRDHA